MPDIAVPSFSLCWDKHSCEMSMLEDCFSSKKGIALANSYYKPTPYIKQDPNIICIILGSPIFNGCMDNESLANTIGADIAGFDPLVLNGQFCIILFSKASKELRIINDRFTSIPIFYADLPKRFLLSTSYKQLYHEVKSQKGFKIQFEQIFASIWFQKLHGVDTFDNLNKFLPAATVLDICYNTGAVLKTYWKPDFAKKHYSSSRAAGLEFVDRLKTSASLMTADVQDKNYGLFLSGGLDSRVALAALADKAALQCISIGFSDNYEVKCARQCARTFGFDHHYLPLDDDLYSTYWHAMHQLSNGVCAFTNAQFVGVAEAFDPEVDVVFHGHGFDYLFQGSYMPAHNLKLFERPTFMRKLKRLDSDIAKHYMYKLSFRLADTHLMSYVQEPYQKQLEESLLQSVKQVLQQGAGLCHTPYDYWEYLTVHALGRHYSRPNLDSMSTCAEQRVLCFENALYDFYLGLPDDLRLNAYAVRFALNHIEPQLGQIATSNTGMPAGWSAERKTLVQIARKLARYFSDDERFTGPQQDQRSWPDRNRYLQKHPAYQAHIKGAIEAAELRDCLTFMDWDAIDRDLPHWFSGKISGGAKLLASLATVSEWLKE